MPATTSSIGYVGAVDSSSRPTSVKVMPMGNEKGSGRRSVYRPTTGCSTDAVSW